MSNPHTSHINVNKIQKENQSVRMSETPPISSKQVQALYFAMNIISDMYQAKRVDKYDEYSACIQLKNAFPSFKHTKYVQDFLINICEANSKEWRILLLTKHWLPSRMPTGCTATDNSRVFAGDLSVVGIVLRNEYDTHSEEQEDYEEELQDLFNEYLVEMGVN